MDFHLDYGLRLNADPEHKSLYSWAINEIGPQGQTGIDLIPWEWSVYFDGTTCELTDSIEIRSSSKFEKLETPEVRDGQALQIKLIPKEFVLSMLGTGRPVHNILLNLLPCKEGQSERCYAWGAVSCTTELDFKNVTEPDVVVFTLHVNPRTFDRYATAVKWNAIDRIAFRVSSVDGFYSEWSPGISTDAVKVLADSQGGQKIDLPESYAFEPPPRLEKVGAAGLYITRRLELPNDL